MSTTLWLSFQPQPRLGWRITTAVLILAFLVEAKEATRCDDLSVQAGRGYYSGEEILACDKAGITAYIPKTQTSTN